MILDGEPKRTSIAHDERCSGSAPAELRNCRNGGCCGRLATVLGAVPRSLFSVGAARLNYDDVPVRILTLRCARNRACPCRVRCTFCLSKSGTPSGTWTFRSPSSLARICSRRTGLSGFPRRLRGEETGFEARHHRRSGGCGAHRQVSIRVLPDTPRGVPAGGDEAEWPHVVLCRSAREGSMASCSSHTMARSSLPDQAMALRAPRSRRHGRKVQPAAGAPLIQASSSRCCRQRRDSLCRVRSCWRTCSEVRCLDKTGDSNDTSPARRER